MKARLLGALIGIGLFAAFLWQAKPARVGAALAQAVPGPVLLAAALNVFLNTAARTRRWAALLAPFRKDVDPGAVELARMLLAGYAASNVLPLRAGEALRAIEVHRRTGVSLAGAFAAQGVEKVVEFLSIGLIAGAAGLVATGALAPALCWSGIAALAGVLLLLALSRMPLSDGAAEARGPFRRALQRTVSAMRTLRKPAAWGRALAWSSLSDISDVAMIALCLHAVGIGLAPAQWIAVFLGINFAILVPGAPAQVGAFEAGAVLSLAALGVGQAEALAFAVVYHAVHFIPITALGLLGMRLAPRRA